LFVFFPLFLTIFCCLLCIIATIFGEIKTIILATDILLNICSLQSLAALHGRAWKESQMEGTHAVGARCRERGASEGHAEEADARPLTLSLGCVDFSNFS